MDYEAIMDFASFIKNNGTCLTQCLWRSGLWSKRVIGNLQLWNDEHG